MRTTYPPFAWSHTRHRTFLACRLRYYFHYYLAQGGWHSGAPHARRLAYALKHLTTLEAVLGIAVHACAGRITAAIRRRRPVPPETDLVRDVRRALNGLWTSRDRVRFRRNPRRHPMLREIYYGSLPDRATVEQVRDSLHSCIRHLVRSPVWEHVARCAPADVQVGESFLRFRLEDTDVVAVPDLTYRLGPAVTILDWKTGAGFGADLQLAVYGLGVEKGATPVSLYGRLVLLRQGTERTIPLGSGSLQSAAERIAESAAEMRELLLDPDGNVPRDRSAFPPAEHRPAACARCNFVEICPFRPTQETEQEATPDARAP